MKTLNFVKKALVVLMMASTVLSAATPAQASGSSRGEVACRNLKIRSGDVAVVEGIRFGFVREFLISAKGNGRVDVMINGVSRGHLDLNGGRGSAVVPVGEYVRSLVFRNLGSSRIVIRKVIAFGRYSVSGGTGGYGIGGGPAEGALGGILGALDEAYEWATPAEIQNHVAPLKSVVSKALAVVQSRGEASAASIQAMTDVLAELNKAQSWLDQLKQATATFQIAVEIETMREELVEILN